MKILLIIAGIIFSLSAGAQHHGRDSVRHSTIERIMWQHKDSVKTFTTDGATTEYIDILRAPQGRGTVRWALYIEAIAPNGHTATDTKTISVFNPDGHNVITHRQENYAKQWVEEQLHGATWDARIPQGQGLIQVWVTGVKNTKITWRYLKIAE